jgi:hypothetical protein
MNEKLFRVVMAIGDCVGIEIPYPLAKKMQEVSNELQNYIELRAVQSMNQGMMKTIEMENEK